MWLAAPARPALAQSSILVPAPALASVPPAAPRPSLTGAVVSSESIAYGPDGLEFRDTQQHFRLALGGRLQFRTTTPFAEDPIKVEDLGRQRENVTAIRRAQFKALGHVFTPRLTFNLQYDLVNVWLLDARVNYAFRPWLQLRAGQWRVDYNRESAGQQQMVERSIVTRVFTLDRQNGVMVHGRVHQGRRSDFTYWTGVFNGTGRSRRNDDGRPMWMARYQWNALGGGVDMSGGDLERSRTVRAILAVGVSGDQSPYTRFAGRAPGQVEDLPPGRSGQYRLAQWAEEGAVRWRGVSLQQEFHSKRVVDRLSHRVRRLDGGYVQGGVFLHEFWAPAPRPLELNARYGNVDPDLASQRDHRDEVTVGANWFIHGHRNKISGDASRLRFETLSGRSRSATRLRLQWDVSF